MDAFFKVKQGLAILKLLITGLLSVLEVWDGKSTYRNSWAGKSSGLVGFDLGPLLQGQLSIAQLKTAYNSLVIGRRGLGW